MFGLSHIYSYVTLSPLQFLYSIKNRKFEEITQKAIMCLQTSQM